MKKPGDLNLCLQCLLIPAIPLCRHLVSHRHKKYQQKEYQQDSKQNQYLRWLEAQMDYANGEYDRYNNSITMFNTAYSDYERYYNRMNMPKGKKLKFF